MCLLVCFLAQKACKDEKDRILRTIILIIALIIDGAIVDINLTKQLDINKLPLITCQPDPSNSNEIPRKG